MGMWEETSRWLFLGATTDEEARDQAITHRGCKTKSETTSMGGCWTLGA